MTALTNLLAGRLADGASQVSRPANAVPGTRNWSIRQRILASFSIILGLMVVMGGVAYTRLVSVEEQASAIAYLLSGEASFVTGVAMPVDGGWSISDGRVP